MDYHNQPQHVRNNCDDTLLVAVINLRAALMEVKRSMCRVEEKLDIVFDSAISQRFKEDHRIEA